MARRIDARTGLLLALVCAYAAGSVDASNKNTKARDDVEWLCNEPVGFAVETMVSAVRGTNCLTSPQTSTPVGNRQCTDKITLAGCPAVNTIKCSVSNTGHVASLSLCPAGGSCTSTVSCSNGIPEPDITVTAPITYVKVLRGSGSFVRGQRSKKPAIAKINFYSGNAQNYTLVGSCGNAVQGFGGAGSQWAAWFYCPGASCSTTVTGDQLAICDSCNQPGALASISFEQCNGVGPAIGYPNPPTSPACVGWAG